MSGVRIDRIAAHRDLSRRGISIMLAEDRGEGMIEVHRLGQPGEMCSPNQIIHEPTMLLSESQSQQLFDDLWAAGLRPTHGADHAGVIAAMDAHLKSKDQHLADMRDVVQRATTTALVVGPTLESRVPS